MGEMRPTRHMWTCSGKIPNPDHRIFKCTECGKENPWLDKPNLKIKTFGELHCLPCGNHSILSMMSDPVFYKPKRKRAVRPTRSQQ